MSIIGLGFQSSQVARAVDLIRDAKRNNDKIVISLTGNIISSGLREIICLLAKSKIVYAIITSGAGVEEDIIKTLGGYVQTEFLADADKVSSSGIYRIGNIGVTHDVYDGFYDWIECRYSHAVYECKGDTTPGNISKMLGYMTNDRNSFLYWCYVNEIPVFCPTFHDGAIGDFLAEYRRGNEGHRVDFLYESVKLQDLLCRATRCGAIILGGGTSKHFTLNNSVPRGGLDWSVVITTATPYDGSDSGGDADEAKTWGKLKLDAISIHISSEATLVFPELARELLLSDEVV